MNTQTQEALKMAIVAMDTWKDIDVLKARKMCKEALAQPAQEPVAVCKDSIVNWVNGKAIDGWLYTYPAPSWQGLSDDEVDYMWEILGNVKKFADAIEQALKEKNT